jgi:tripartite-type tricarboxylate transporter receptor subunit TctC
MRRRTALGLLGAAAGSLVAARAGANEGGLVRIVVPYAAGGQTDTMARLLAEPMQKQLGRNVIVDNRPGAAALIATRYVQALPPTGDALLFHNSGFVALPMLNKAATYDPIADFDAVCQIGESPNFLMVTDAVPAQTVAEFIAYARAHPGLECANSGVNSGGHISAMLLEKLAGIRLTHIPYKGSAEVTRALLGGEVKLQLSVTTDSLNPYIRSGKIRMLGVASKQKSMLAPMVPTISDFVPGYSIDGWFGMLTAVKTPLDRREAMAAVIGKALQDPAIREKFAALFMDIQFKGPREFAVAVSESKTFFTSVVERLQLTPT